MRILLSIPIFGDQRRELFDSIIAPNLIRRDSVIPVLIGEGKHDKPLASKHGLYFIDHKNKPLGAKFNIGCLAAIQMKCTHWMIIGSDDIISNQAFDAMIKHDADVVGWKDIYFYDLYERRLAYWPGYSGTREGDTIGCGRLVKVELIKRLGGKLYEDNRNIGLDGSMTRRLKTMSDVSVKTLSLKDENAFMVDIKGAGNIWPYNHSDYHNMTEVDNTIMQKYGC
jgi:hypothetical protein